MEFHLYNKVRHFVKKYVTFLYWDLYPAGMHHAPTHQPDKVILAGDSNGFTFLKVSGKGVENSTLVEVIDYYCSRLKLSALFHNYSDVFNAKSTPVFARR